MKRTLALIALAAASSMASAQAVTGIVGGSQFGSYHGGTVAGDVVGWSFDVNTSIVLTDLGVWNQDTQIGFEGLTSDHMIGLWDSSGNLLTSGVAGPGGTIVGDWTYADVLDVILSVGERYTIGALYNAGGLEDGDSYISSPSSMSLASEINATTNGVFATDPDLGFVFPGSDSTNLGRFGPNFLFAPVPAPGSIAILGLGGLVATRRRR